ncbi:MAG: hypothetical protein U1F43_19890 [Myxococcota bacterium]
MAHASDSPGTLVDLIRTRLAALPESERTLVELVAIAGEPIDTHLIRAATGADQRDLNMLIHDRLLRARPGGRGETVVAWHDRVREAASSLDTATRIARHRVLAETGARVGGVSDFFLHTHWRGAGEPTLAIEHGLRAAQAAERAFAFDQAASVYRAVLELAPTRTPDLVKRLADAMKNAGRGIEAGQAYLEAAGLATATPDAARRLEIAAAEQFLFAGGLDEGAAVIKKVLGRIGLKLGRSLVSVMGQLAWGSLRLKLRGLEFTPRAEAETAPEARAVVDTLWSATIGMSLAHPLTSVAIQKRHLRKALELGEPLRVARALGVELAFSGLPGGKDDRVSRNLSERARAVARMVPHPYAETFVTMGDGGTHWLRGHWVEAQSASEAAVEVFETECAGVSWEKDTASFVALSAIYHRGRLPELARRVDLALADAMSRGDRFIETQLRTRFMPILAYAEDRPDEVALELERALSRWTAHGYQVVHLFAWMANVHGHLYAGRPDEAAELFARGTRPLKRSLMLMGQYYRAQFHDLAGRVARSRAAT